MSEKSPKILILHDYFLYKGGGERLVICLAQNLKADIATAFIAKDAFDPRQAGLSVRELLHESIWSKIPGFRYLQTQIAFLFRTTFFKEYDVIIYSGDCLTALLRAQSKINIAYIHTPPRHLFDLYHERLTSYAWWKKIIFVPFAKFNQWRWRTLSRRFDAVLTNSHHVEARIKKYLGLNAVVVYPPCTTLPFKNLGQGDYFFSWARLYDVKRVALIVEAFTKMPEKKLIVASGGPEMERLQKMAAGHNNIQLIGWITDAQLLEYLGNCLATIYIPVREDFGMSAVESMVAGKPVIGVAEGGLLEIIKDGQNGVLLPENPTVENMITAVRALTPEKAKAMAAACQATGENFSDQRFVDGVRTAIEQVWSKK
jgi:glycosyltransferase involved in cell wall biosynthesis